MEGLRTPPRKILVIRPSALGDVCRTAPVVASLKRAYPDASIDWVVQDTFVDAVSAHPAVRRVIPFARRRYSSWWKPAVAREIGAWLWSLRREGYDVVLDCQGLARSGVFTRWTGAPVRAGYRQAAEGAWLALNRRVDAPMSMHTVDRMLRLVEAVGAAAVRDMRLYAPAIGLVRAREAMGDVLDRPYAVIAPTSRWPGKLWPSERFAAVVGEILRDERYGVGAAVVVGSEHERGQCGAVLEACRANGGVVDAIGRTSVASLMALVKGASLVIGSDSACVHMAVGFERPLVALYGPTDVGRVGPYGREESVVQRLRHGDVFDHKDEARGRAMMERISVEDVLAKTGEVMRGVVEPPACEEARRT